MRWQWWRSRALSKKEMLIKNAALTDFPPLRGNSPVHRLVCVFDGVCGGIGKEGGESHVRWLWCERQDLVKREMLVKNEELTNFSHYKSKSPVRGWVCAFADVFWGHWEGRRWVKYEMVVVQESRSWKEGNAYKNSRTHPFPPFKKLFPCMWTGLCICWCLWGHCKGKCGSNVRWRQWRS